ncbi:hypothetical protein [Dyadobacter pollutisoli]|uniref:Uncharacterized protein n=1 Tax=Dyadobacter pollutisoli TaxID=2910158 RepID=A0A9E8NG82_9BACT|nr:hypothetical protein [Dyadobacter pollutisoli]WAC13509.1 hypothetical protein ON006_06040 [Dyadobacter pollutisoli]
MRFRIDSVDLASGDLLVIQEADVIIADAYCFHSGKAACYFHLVA